MKGIHISIRGQDYILTQNDCGFRVTANTSRTDRFSRTYQVYTDMHTKRPTKCTCPDCVHRENWCKHLQAVEDFLGITTQQNNS